MKSLYDYIVSPSGDRYNNSVGLEDGKSLILNTEALIADKVIIEEFAVVEVLVTEIVLVTAPVPVVVALLLPL